MHRVHTKGNPLLSIKRSTKIHKIRKVAKVGNIIRPIGWVFDWVQGLRQFDLQEDSRAFWCLAGLGLRAFLLGQE
jgi:hypothetical protein